MKGRGCVFTCLIISSVLAWYKVLTCKSSLQRKNEFTGAVTVCCTTNCTPGFSVKKCTENGTADRCVQCPEGTYLDDYTTSVLPTDCVPYDCPPGAVPVENFSKSGCHKKCQCDVSLEYVGTDPCNCQKSSVTCPRGLQLTIHNVCSALTTQSLILSSFSTSRGLTDIITTEVEGPEISTVMETVTTPANTTTSDPAGDGGSVGAVLGGAAALVVVPVILVVFIYYKRKERFRQDTSRENQLEMNTVRVTMASMETSNEIRTGEHSREIISNGRPFNGRSETVNEMGTGETMQNGDVRTPLLVEIQSQETRNNTLYMEGTKQKELVTGNKHHTDGGEETRHPPLVTPFELISSNTEHLFTAAEPLGSTIGLQSAPTLVPESIERENDDPDSLRLGDAPPLIPDSLR